MRRSTGIWFLAACSFVGASGKITLAAEPTPMLKIGMLQGMFRDVQPAMVQALSRPLRDMIEKQTGLTGNVEVLENAETLARRMSTKQIHLGVFHGYEYAWIRKEHPEIVPLVITIPTAKKLQACVIVHRDSEYKTLADLKENHVIVPRGSKAHCWLYLDHVREKLPATTAQPQTTPAMTPMETIDAVVTGQITAGLVEISALEGYETVLPGAFKNIRVLCQSELFPQTVIAYQKDTVSAGTVERVRKLLTEAHRTTAGKPLMMLWNLRGFEDIPDSYTDHLEAVRRVYPPPATTMIKSEK